MNNNNSIKLSHYSADFFVMRSPCLSLQHLTDWQYSDKKQLREQLRHWLELDETQEALYLASPSLLDRIEQWYDDPDSKKGKKIELALAKYFIRMAGRPTPFGLFSNNSLGKVADTTLLELTSNVEVKRKSRLDMHYLAMLQEQLVKEHWTNKKLLLSTNPTVYSMGDQIRYIENYTANGERHYRLSSVGHCSFVTSTLESAKQQIDVNDLVSILCRQSNELSTEDALGFIEQLVNAQLLLPNLPLALTGGSPDSSFATSLALAGFDMHSSVIESVLNSLKHIDEQTTNSPNEYRKIAKQLKALSVPVKENKLIQVDCFRTDGNLQLDKTLCDGVARDVALFNSLISPSKNPLQAVIKKINSDFVGRMVPLQEFIDDESGWSMSSDKGFSTPLLKGVGLRQTVNSGDEMVSMTPFERLIMESLSSLAEPFQKEINFSRKDVKSCMINQQVMPDSMAIMFQLFNKNQDAKEILFRGSYGPSAANFLGRFCHLDKELAEKTIDLLKLEEACNPNAIYAEIVHLPQGRLGNVIARPILRQYEIPIVGDSGVAQDYQISLDDLFVYVESTRVKLWSKKHNKEIIPRLSSAHNYSARSLGIYSFLCMLQNQNVSLPRFTHSSVFDSVKYMPRIKLGDLLLSKRRWKIKRSELSALLRGDSTVDGESLQRLRGQFKMPEWVSYSVSDNTLLINFSNPIMLEVLLAETKGHYWITLEEVLDFELESQSSLDGQCLKHELILPLIRSKNKNKNEDETEHSQVDKSQHIAASKVARSFAPGSEWLSAKVYLGNSTAENVLANVINPLVTSLQHQNVIQGFFFLRYGDPDWHIRLRFNGNRQVLLTQVLPRLNKALEPLLLNGPVNSFVLDTYEQEVERYGGDSGVKLAEQLFYSNSKTCLQLLNKVNELPDEYRWRSVLQGCDQLLNTFDFNFAQKLSFITNLREGFGREFGDSGTLRKELGKKYRQYQEVIIADFTSDKNDEIIKSCKDIILSQASEIRQIAIQYHRLEESNQLTESLNNILSAILHMFNNRMFVAYSRQQEFVIYDLLRRYYEYSCNQEDRTKS